MNIRRIIAAFIAVMLIPAAVSAFSDVNETDWFYENVTGMTENGYLAGYEDGSFRPTGTITKAEFVSITARVSGLKPSDKAEANHWAARMLDSALESGYYDWDEIPPTGEAFDEPITRQLAVKIVMKTFLPELRGDYNRLAGEAADFDALDGRYYESMIAAYSGGVVYGDDKGRINPKEPITRAEACAIIMRAANKKGGLVKYEEGSAAENVSDTERAVSGSGGVSYNGTLHTEGTYLVNERGERVVLRGMSSHGLQWFGQFASDDAIKATAERGANLFRCAMYTAEGGYINDPSVKNTLINAVDNAIRHDMYVIIDWHILSDGDPLRYADEAESFFEEMSKRYASEPAVIYEICNEPNGAVTWSGNVKPYAERIIPVIRRNTNALILVGSPTWSQDLHEAAKDPLSDPNVMYTCHFYAGTHTDWLRRRIVESDLPVFVSEWGTSAADGNGGVYLDEAQRWIDFMDEHSISWANWSLCDKNESSAALKPGADVSDGISADELTESGSFVFGNIRNGSDL